MIFPPLLPSAFAGPHSSAAKSATKAPSKRNDRIGVIASALCAVHCALTPVLLLALPSFGQIWAHPLSHWAAALLVVPLAAWSMLKGYPRHRRKWVVAAGMSGIALVLLGAAAPWLFSDPAPAAATCTDACCPSTYLGDDGSQRLHIPLASILTTIGGLFLIISHIGNLCRCKCCAPKPASERRFGIS
ncbi:MerC domain-containing protein [Haloferula chungangensis]|uniref:MerC domain-containing protein n=1 Tax=Haloferula chungangensis TaxID=1048331 RepID=A0ABW2LAK6_9BACT